MRTTHFALLVLCGAAVLILVSAGCASKKNTPPVAESQERELSRRTAMNVRTDASLPREGTGATSGGDGAGADATQPVDTAHLLANRTASYSKELDDLISKRAAKTQAAAGAAADPKASAVQWEGTDPQTRGASSPTQQPEQSPTTTVKPVMDASSSPKSVTSSPAVANRNAAVGSSKPNIDGAVASAAPHAGVPMGANENTSLTIPDSPRGAARTAGASMSSADELESRIAKRIKDDPRDIASHLEYQLLMFLKEQPVPDLNAIASLPSEDREMVTAIVDGLTNFRSSVRADNNMLLSKKVKPLLEAADRMRSQAELSIPTLVLCTRVDGFGRYDPVDPPRFIAGKEQQTIVYCEIENFSSQLDSASKLWQTELTQDATLYTETGMPIWADKQVQITDSSRNRRHDFFVRKIITVPGNLNLGRYVLKVSIVDKQANRVAEASLPVQVVAQ